MLAGDLTFLRKVRSLDFMSLFAAYQNHTTIPLFLKPTDKFIGYNKVRDSKRHRKEKTQVENKENENREVVDNWSNANVTKIKRNKQQEAGMPEYDDIPIPVTNPELLEDIVYFQDRINGQGRLFVDHQ